MTGHMVHGFRVQDLVVSTQPCASTITCRLHTHLPTAHSAHITRLLCYCGCDDDGSFFFTSAFPPDFYYCFIHTCMLSPASATLRWSCGELLCVVECVLPMCT